MQHIDGTLCALASILTFFSNIAVNGCLSNNASDVLRQCRFIAEKENTTMTYPKHLQFYIINVPFSCWLFIPLPAALHSWIKNKGGLKMVAKDKPPEAWTSPSLCFKNSQVFPPIHYQRISSRPYIRSTSQKICLLHQI